LIADDQELMRSAVAELVQNCGEDWRVDYEAESGRDAIDKVRLVEPDLVILDLLMPEGDGVTAGREIHALFPDIPIILFTLVASPWLENEAKSAGIQAVVHKAEGTSLIAAIREVLQSNTRRNGDGCRKRAALPRTRNQGPADASLAAKARPQPVPPPPGGLLPRQLVAQSTERIGKCASNIEIDLLHSRLLTLSEVHYLSAETID